MTFLWPICAGNKTIAFYFRSRPGCEATQQLPQSNLVGCSNACGRATTWPPFGWLGFLKISRGNRGTRIRSLSYEMSAGTGDSLSIYYPSTSWPTTGHCFGYDFDAALFNILRTPWELSSPGWRGPACAPEINYISI